jgi:hypothetical protein
LPWWNNETPTRIPAGRLDGGLFLAGDASDARTVTAKSLLLCLRDVITICGGVVILDTAFLTSEPMMAHSQKPAGRKPASKFAHLRKKMEQSKLRTKVKTMHVRKSGNR